EHVELTQPGSMVINPGQSMSLTCKVSGYSLTDSSYCTAWIRQPAGKALEWIGRICSGGGTDYSDKLKSRFEVTRDTSSSTMTSLKSEDTAVYYCQPTTGWHWPLDVCEVSTLRGTSNCWKTATV
uniref:Ig-like domain-containing protein n=1 Tax=Pygocentrus nattereri TaxID=42514 RepID=A0A3B4BJQ0_PYGNA